ncbi:MAG: hypothetical protein IJ509_02850 [Bacilli bacterium]|nr:hypothetical protein [Bacilli bacterium]
MMKGEMKDFVAYEYLTLNVKIDKEALYRDCYENLGWIFINNMALIDREDYFINNYDINNHRIVKINFKRDRRIKNKIELQSLQRKLEVALKEIERLEGEPNSFGIIWAMIIGMIGTVFLALSVFAITASNPLYIIGTLCGIVGLIGWILPYFVYKKVKTSRELENVSLIEEQYNVIYDSCERAKKLIN